MRGGAVEIKKLREEKISTAVYFQQSTPGIEYLISLEILNRDVKVSFIRNPAHQLKYYLFFDKMNTAISRVSEMKHVIV